MDLKRLSRLLKRSEQDVEKRRLELLKLQKMQDAHEHDKSLLQQQKQQEYHRPSMGILGTLSLEAYGKAVDQKIQTLEKEIQTLKDPIQCAQNTLQKSYKSMKVLDIFFTHAVKEARALKDKQEQSRLDDLPKKHKTP